MAPRADQQAKEDLDPSAQGIHSVSRFPASPYGPNPPVYRPSLAPFRVQHPYGKDFGNLANHQYTDTDPDEEGYDSPLGSQVYRKDSGTSRSSYDTAYRRSPAYASYYDGYLSGYNNAQASYGGNYNTAGGLGGVGGGLVANRRSGMQASASGLTCSMQGMDMNLFALAAMAAFFAIQMLSSSRRRKRDVQALEELGDANIKIWDWILDLGWSGLEEFEDKVDKLAHGQGDENSWIGNLYHKFKGSFMGGEDNTIEQDGLEPPILDDKWGLGDVHTLFSENNSTLTIDNSTVSTNVTEHAISKRSLEDEDAEFLEETAEDDEFVKSLSGESKCRTKFWRCVGKVAKGSIHYMQEPGGISGAFQKTMFRMAFHGGFGNVWNALMTIPEARRVKRCLNAQEECLSYEALRLELDAGSEFADEHTNKQRLIVNPELVENQDTSDGSEQFSPEVQAALDNNEI